jgi:pimeloyl-ACP methyl ester carboxylesterase
MEKWSLLFKNIRKTYILTHGAWHGSWCWHKVASHLQNLGHNVIVPDLPGHYHNLRCFKEITLETYVNHIEEIVQSTQRPVVLVGHSMAGIILTQVAENMPDNIDQLIYISAFIPQNGGSLMDEEKQAEVPTIALEVTIDKENASISLNSSKRLRELFYANCCDKDAEYCLAHLQDQPLRPFIDTISISNDRFGRLPKLYIECLQDKAITIKDQRRMHSRIKCTVKAIDTDHSPFFSADRQLAKMLQ